jgi:hypothetical protein
VFFIGFCPLLFAAILNVLRAAHVRVQWGRHRSIDDRDACFGAFFGFRHRAHVGADRDPDIIKYVLTQSYMR